MYAYTAPYCAAQMRGTASGMVLDDFGAMEEPRWAIQGRLRTEQESGVDKLSTGCTV